MTSATYTVQVRQRGVITIPIEVRREYGIREDDVLTLIDLGDALVLTPKLSVVPKLAREIEKKRERVGVTVEELLEDVHRDRGVRNEHLNRPEP